MERFLDPTKVLKELKLKKNMIGCDFGCGSGGWVIPLAKKLEDGRVFAIDLLEEPLSALRAKIKLEKISNIEIIQADVEKQVAISDGICDLILMTNLLFECEDKKGVLAEAKRVLKKGGRILVVDWKKEAPFGPREGRVSPDEIMKIAVEFNLKTEKEFDASLYHFGLILVK